MADSVKIKRFVTSWFGLGWMPFAPGTWGSLGPVIIYMILASLMVPAAIAIPVMAAIIVIASVLCVAFVPAVSDLLGRKDPGEVVIDEVAGQGIVLIVAMLAGGKCYCASAVLAFVLFRIFDIVKPWPVRQLEKLPDGWGVLVDDLMAGVYAAICFWLAAHFGLIDKMSGLFAAGGKVTPIAAMGLGVLQGLTEFLPVSSSGHLVLFEHLFEMDPDTPAMQFFDLTVHVGTVLAIFIVYRRTFARAFKGSGAFIARLKDPVGAYKTDQAFHFVTMMLVTTFITGLGYALLNDFFDSARTLTITAICWSVTATILLVSDFRKNNNRSILDVGILAAVIIGLAQTVSLLPGISRSGSTICAAILIGIVSDTAITYSFMIAIPAILGATLIHGVEIFREGHYTELSLPAVGIGVLMSCLVGVAALNILIKLTQKRRLRAFAIYCYLLSAAAIVYCLKNC